MLELGPAPGPYDDYKHPGPVEFPGGNSWDKWAAKSESAKKGAVGRKRPQRDDMMKASDAMWGMGQVKKSYDKQGNQGMWGAFSPSRTRSRSHA